MLGCTRLGRRGARHKCCCPWERMENERYPTVTCPTSLLPVAANSGTALRYDVKVALANCSACQAASSEHDQLRQPQCFAHSEHLDANSQRRGRSRSLGQVTGRWQQCSGLTLVATGPAAPQAPPSPRRRGSPGNRRGQSPRYPPNDCRAAARPQANRFPGRVGRPEMATQPGVAAPCLS